MAGDNDKRVHITSNFTSNGEVFYERIEDKDTGEIEVKETTKPSTVTSKTTISTRPYHYEREVSPKSKIEPGLISKLAQSKPEYDAREL